MATARRQRHIEGEYRKVWGNYVAGRMTRRIPDHQCYDNRPTHLLQQPGCPALYGTLLLDQGETCSLNRVERFTRLAGIKAQIG